MTELMTGIAIGIATATLLLTVGVRGVRRFFKNAKLIRNYWLFVILFFVVNIIIYSIVLTQPGLNNEVFVSVINQFSGLLFAIFTGYFAFSQVMESRFEKLENEALSHFRRRNYTDAIKTYESAHAIKRKDSSVLSNLIELYVIQGQYSKADDQLSLLRKITPPEKSEVPHIVCAISYIFRGHLGEASEAIGSIVEIIKSRERRTYYPRWNFDEIKVSPKYGSLKGDAKKSLDNLEKYIKRELSEELNQKFEAGDHTF
jgi:tetratricopeptide (TPR) repeat protein